MLFLFVSSILNRFLIIPVVKDKTVVKKVKLALAIPIGVPTTFTEEIIQVQPLIPERTIKVLSM